MLGHVRSLFGCWALVAILMIAFGAPAGAYTVTLLPNHAGGNPGDLCDTYGGNTCIDVLEFGEVKAGDVLELTWDYDGSQGPIGPDLVPDFPTISSTGSVSVASITASTVLLDITLTNTTTALPIPNPGNMPAGFTASIVTIGAEVDGFISGVLSTAGSFLDTYDTNNIAGGPGLTLDFCASTDASCNSGSAMAGVAIGGSDTVQFTLTGAFDPIAGLTMRNISTKWQTNYDDLVTPDDPDVTSGNSSFEQPGLPPGWVPEPASGLLMGIGLVGLGLLGRKY
jgi:hypothetical protein